MFMHIKGYRRSNKDQVTHPSMIYQLASYRVFWCVCFFLFFVVVFLLFLLFISLAFVVLAALDPS